jgi:adhesin/invasin
MLAALALALAALLAGLAAPVAAPAATGHRPVVASVSAKTGPATGGTTVVITGKYFKLNGRNVVRAVAFGAKAAKRVRVLSATKIRCTAPAGKGTVHVRVTTTKGTSRRVAADRFTYVGPATEMSLNAGDAQTASAGTAVAVKPSVLVEDAGDHPVAGVHVTFAVAAGGGSVTGADAVSNASGIATVGSWKLGGTAGANTLTATAAGLAGSPVTFTATGDAGILTVQQAGTPVRSYSLTELQALTAFSGWAGLFKNPAIGPDAVTGVKVTDVVADALGTALASGQSVEVSEVDATPYSKTMTYDQLTGLTGFTYYDATTRLAMTPTGTLAAILIYSDPVGAVMPAASGPLRFAVADSVSENMVYAPTNTSVSKVNVLNVTGP